MVHIFEYKDPVKNFKVTQKTVYNGHKDFFATNYWGVSINKISIFGSLFHRVWVSLLHEHALLYQYINSFKEIHVGNRILVLPISLYTRITNHD